jgi:hypothetical protein
MTSFEEQFPSLYNNGVDEHQDLVTLSKVTQFCLDKQRVKEALLRHKDCDGARSCQLDENNTTFFFGSCMGVVLKELSLDDEKVLNNDIF